ncbi:hypothetical protein M3611_23595 [Priestia megaterium]|uniref:hypothetical protein n=1 Tax=Priestia megaterium TaxID=1404 RepID=UPI00203BBA19|nr:hypothetical protein [Priestia megaterium]MCM3154999.1 hypothetical protein [Priestia megaterium]
MEVKAYELENSYQFICTQDEYEFKYDFVKEPPEGVTLKQYLQDCKSNSIGLAEWEIAQRTTAQQEQEPPKEIEI